MFNYWVSFVFGCPSDSCGDHAACSAGTRWAVQTAWIPPSGSVDVGDFFLRPADMKESFVRAQNQESNIFFFDSLVPGCMCPPETMSRIPKKEEMEDCCQY